MFERTKHAVEDFKTEVRSTWNYYFYKGKGPQADMPSIIGVSISKEGFDDLTPASEKIIIRSKAGKEKQAEERARKEKLGKEAVSGRETNDTR